MWIRRKPDPDSDPDPQHWKKVFFLYFFCSARTKCFTENISKYADNWPAYGGHFELASIKFGVKYTDLGLIGGQLALYLLRPEGDRKMIKSSINPNLYVGFRNSCFIYM